MKHIDVSIIIPAYNEAVIIEKTLVQLADFVDRHKDFLGVCEVIIVAAGDDATETLASSYNSRFDRLKIIRPERRVGKGRDVRLGFLAAHGEVQLFMDADLSTPLPHVIDMVKHLRSGTDIVIGARRLNKIHGTPLRSALSRASNWLTRTVILPRIRDTQCGFKGFRQEVATHIFPKQTVMGWGFDLELLVLAREAGFALKQLPINDWDETRDEELRGGHVGAAAISTLLELGRIWISMLGRWCVRHATIAPLITAVAIFGLAFAIGPFRSIWFDEAYSAALIRQSWSDLIHFTAVDVHPPLYYILLKAWTLLFGDSELGLRSLSMVCAGLAGGIGVALAKYMFGARVAVISMPFVVLSPMLLRYAIEARMYALASLIGIAATYILVRAFDAHGRRKLLFWTAYAVLVAAGMYTLNFSALIWLVHLIWCIMRAGKPRSLKEFVTQPWMLAFLGAVILYAPWLPTLMRQTVQSSFWLGPVTIRDVINVATIWLDYQSISYISSWQSLIALIGITVTIWLVATARLDGLRHRRYFQLLILYTVLPVVVLFLLSMPPLRPVFFDRYFSHTLLGGYIMIGVATGLQRQKKRMLLAGTTMIIVLALGVSSLAQRGNFVFNTSSQPRIKEVATYLQDRPNPSAVLSDNPGQYIELSYYLKSRPMFFYHRKPTPTIGGYAMLHNSTQRISKASQLTSPTVWYVYYGEQPKLPLTGYTQNTITTIGNYRVASYTRLPTDGKAQ